MRHKIRAYGNRLRTVLHAVVTPLRRAGKRMAQNAIKYSNRGPRSLANRILLLQFLWAVVVYILVIAAMWYAANNVIESSLRSQAERWVAKLDEMGIPFYVSSSRRILKVDLDDLRNFPEVVGVRFLDKNGKNVLAKYLRRGESNAGFDDVDDRVKEAIAAQLTRHGRPFVFERGEDNRIRVIAPLMVKSIAADGLLNFSLENAAREKREVIGYLNIIFDYSFATKQLHYSLLYASVIIAVLMVFAAVAGRILIRWALHPLSRLEEPLSRLANGEIDVTVESTGDHEIVQIGRALNTTIGALRERDEELRRLANHDTLTGLNNRKHFNELLEAEIHRIEKNGGGSALFFFDLDRFKHINDTYGHAAGDRLLVQIAELLRKRLREDDLLARFGGDEFVALIRNVDRKRAQELGAELVSMMQEFTFYEGVDAIKIQFSVGITLIADGRSTPRHYLKQADIAVHEAKSQGRNRYFIYEQEITPSMDDYTSGWYERLMGAIQEEHFLFYYQPLAGLKGQPARIYETLLRLPDPRLGMIVPGGFFPAMERFGLMPGLDRLVIEMAIRALEKADKGVVLSVNCSEHIFADHDIVNQMGQLLSTHAMKPGQLILEVSEPVVVRNLERMKPVVQKLSAMGIRFAIDDFGAGFASFSYLKQLPVHYLKIHGSLIERVAVDPLDRITISSIIAMARELDMQTVAKFVPDQETLVVVGELGIDYAQGDYLGEPGPHFGQNRQHFSTVKYPGRG